MKKLRSEKIPRELKPLFYSFGVAFEDIVDRIEKWESFRTKDSGYRAFKNLNEYEPKRKSYNDKDSSKKCYTCNMY
jgi:hypothetical protein